MAATDFSGGYEVPTKTVQNVQDFVFRQFGDESGVQITGDDIVRWVNSAQGEINQRNRVLRTKATTTATPGQEGYAAPSDTLQIEGVLYNGKLIPNMDFITAQEFISREDPQNDIQLPFPRFWYVWSGSFVFWPTPQAAYPITMFYTRKPVQVAQSTDLLDLPDKYFEVIVAYVMKQAYEMDEDWEAVQAKAGEIEQRIGLYNGEESEGSDLSYSTISLVEGEYF